MKPHTDIPASDLWQKLSETPRPTEVVDFPRADSRGNPIGKVRIQVLRMEEHDRARLTAQKKLRDNARALGFERLESADMDSPGVREVLGDMTARELLAMACLSDVSMSEDASSPFYPRIFPSAEGLSKVLSADETAVLFSLFTIVTNKFGPFENNIEGDEDAWIRRLAEGGDAFPLVSLPWPQLVRLTSLLAGRISTLYRILGSQWESLPDGSKSALASYFTDISYFGGQRESSDQPGSVGLVADELISLDTATRLAAALRQ